MDSAILYQDLQRAVQNRQDLLAIVSHDLRTPLATISTGVEVLARKHAAAGITTYDRHFDAIQRNTARMSRLISDLLDVGTIQAGRFSVALGAQEVQTILRDAMEAHASAAAQRGIELVCDAPQLLPRILADRDRILQVLSNLMGNALKFTDHGGRVTLKAWQHDERLVFAVEDTGLGIEPGVQTHVFDPYWSVPSARRGSGLGLFISRGIVEAHGGSIWLESHQGRGTTFYVSIPVAP